MWTYENTGGQEIKEEISSTLKNCDNQGKYRSCITNEQNKEIETTLFCYLWLKRANHGQWTWNNSTIWSKTELYMYPMDIIMFLSWHFMIDFLLKATFFYFSLLLLPIKITAYASLILSWLIMILNSTIYHIWLPTNDAGI